MIASIKHGIIALTAFLLCACPASELVLRTEVSGRDIITTFYKRGFFGSEYRVRACVKMAILEAGGERIWYVRARPELPNLRPCRELDQLRVGKAPDGFDVGIALDRPPGSNRGFLTVSSEEGVGGTRIDLTALH